MNHYPDVYFARIENGTEHYILRTNWPYVEHYIMLKLQVTIDCIFCI